MFEKILRKLENYCAYRERSEHEVYLKAIEYGCLPPTAQKAVELLIESGFLNPQRYIRAVVIGKFKNNGWGKNKIKMHLRAQKIKEQDIQDAFQNEISDSDYKKTLLRLAQSKWNSLKKEEDLLKKKQKIARFLIARGFEASLVFTQINHLKDE